MPWLVPFVSVVIGAFANTSLAASPAQVLAATTAADWRTPAPDQTLLMELTGGRKVVIELAAAFVPRHANRIATLTRAHWYDGLAIVRVQDNYVTQWGDADGTHPLPAGITKMLAAEFSQPAMPAGVTFTKLPDRDAYAEQVGFASGWPVAMDKANGPVWMTHCYGMVGAGRDAEADSGGAGELCGHVGQAGGGQVERVTVTRGQRVDARAPGAQRVEDRVRHADLRGTRRTTCLAGCGQPMFMPEGAVGRRRSGWPTCRR